MRARVLLPALVLSLHAGAALACDVAVHEVLPRSGEQQAIERKYALDEAAQLLHQSDRIFVGEVRAKRRAGSARLMELKPVRALKGPQPALVEVKQRLKDSDCGAMLWPPYEVNVDKPVSGQRVIVAIEGPVLTILGRSYLLPGTEVRQVTSTNSPLGNELLSRAAPKAAKAQAR